MGRKSELGPAQRRDIVLMMLRKEDPIATLARRCGVSETTLRRWRDDFLTGGEAALAYGRGKKADGRAAEIERLKKDLARRDQVIGELTIAKAGARRRRCWRSPGMT
ncbi:MAG: helix-turn-helix domain-containing protein [Planctomycetota bacterium]|jgi:transposase-like protein